MVLTLVLPAALALPAGGAAADLTIVSAVTTLRGAARTQTQYISSSRLRLSDGERDTIVDLTTGKVTLLNPRRKEYSETSLAELRVFLDQMEAAMAGRSVFDRAIAASASVTVVKVEGSGRKIAGYDTERYTLSMGDAMRLDAWVAPALPVPAEYFDARKFVYATLGPIARRHDLLLSELKKIKGFPLATVSDSRMRVTRRQVTIEATEVREGALPDSIFVIPSDYRKVDSPFGGVRPMRSPRPPS